MSHHHEGDLIGLVSGSAIALLAHLAQWVSASTFLGDLLHTVLFGLVGGAAGYLGKRAIERMTRKRNTNNDQ